MQSVVRSPCNALLTHLSLTCTVPNGCARYLEYNNCATAQLIMRHRVVTLYPCRLEAEYQALDEAKQGRPVGAEVSEQV